MTDIMPQLEGLHGGASSSIPEVRKSALSSGRMKFPAYATASNKISYLTTSLSALLAHSRAKTPAWALTWRFALTRLLCGIR
jgi:hypothetical protein